MAAKELKPTVTALNKIKEGVFIMALYSRYLAGKCVPGNFIHIKIRSVFLRRPFSIHNVVGDTVYILFKVRGKGTAELAKYKKGERINVIGPLGRGFPLTRGNISENKPADSRPVFVAAGGIGVAPLLFLVNQVSKGKNSKQRRCAGKKDAVKVLLGASSEKGILCEKDFKKYGCDVMVATDDGTKGFKGNVAALLRKEVSRFSSEESFTVYSCGPEGMVKELININKKYPRADFHVSLDQFMGCGLGVCCGCAIETRDGYKKVCKDGPVFNVKDIEKPRPLDRGDSFTGNR